jgi:hypothetical protein
VSSPSPDWWTQKDTHGVIPDASSALRGAWWSRLVTWDETWVFHYTPESKAESMTWKHPHSPVKMKFKTVQSPGKVMATVFWNVHRVLLVDFTPPRWTINSAAYQETKETQGGYSAQETRIVEQRTRSSSFARQCSTSQCCSNRESLELLGLGNSSTSTIHSWFGTVGLQSIPRDEKAPQRSASTPVKMFKMK